MVQPSRRAVVVCRAKAANISEARKLLATRGWHRTWIDGVTERITRRQVTASVEEMTNVVRALRPAGGAGLYILLILVCRCSLDSRSLKAGFANKVCSAHDSLK